MRKTVLTVGELLWDLMPDGEVTLGGAPFNFNYRVNCLGDRGLMVSRLGRDELGRRAHERIVELGMDTTFLQWDDRAPTGTVRVSFDERHNPDYFIVPGVAYDHISPSPDLARAAGEADCVCFGTLVQRADQTRRTLMGLLESAGATCKLLDINLRKACYSRETISESLRHADILKCNDAEAAYLGELFGLAVSRPDAAGLMDLAETMIERWSLTHCVITLGERGALAVAGAGERVYVPGYRTTLVDSVGAGDAFTAAFLHQLLRAAPLAECCRHGNALGAMVCAQKGATEPIAAAEVEAFQGAREADAVEPALAAWAAR